MKRLILAFLLISQSVFAQYSDQWGGYTLTSGPVRCRMYNDGSVWEPKPGIVTYQHTGYGALVRPAASGYHVARVITTGIRPEWFAAPSEVVTNWRPKIQAALNVAEIHPIKSVELEGRQYPVDAVKYGNYRVCLVIPSEVRLVGKTRGTMLFVKDGSFTISNTTWNRVIINEGSDSGNPSYSNNDKNITLENIYVEVNPSAQSSNTINGIALERITGLRVINCFVHNSIGTGSNTENGAKELAAYSFRYCWDVVCEKNIAVADSVVASSTGFSFTKCTNIQALSCRSEGHRAMNFTNSYCRNLFHFSCESYYGGTKSFNEEHSTNVDYNYCVAGGKTAVITPEDLEFGAPYPSDKYRTRVGSGFADYTAGFYFLNTSGGNNINVTNCTATGFSDGTGNGTHTGLSIRGCRRTTVATASGTTLTVADSIFTPFMENRRLLLSGTLVRHIVRYISPTQVQVNNTVSSSAGQPVILYGATINIRNSTINNNDYNAKFDDDANLKKVAARTTNIVETVTYPCRSSGNYRHIGQVGPNEKWVTGMGLPVDAYTAAQVGGTNTPAIPASGGTVFNDFPFDVTVTLIGGSGVTTGIIGNISDNTVWATSSNPITLHVGERLQLNYTTAPTWEWKMAGK